MNVTKGQLSEFIYKHLERSLEFILLESIMLLEHWEYFLRGNSASGNKCNGVRPGPSFSHVRSQTFRISHECYECSHP